MSVMRDLPWMREMSVPGTSGTAWDGWDGSGCGAEHGVLAPSPSRGAQEIPAPLAPWILRRLPQPPGSQRAGGGTESCHRDILAFVEVFAQHFVMCLCQCQTRQGALGRPLTLTGCSLPAPQFPHRCHIPGTCCHTGNPLLPPLLHPSLHCRVLGTPEMGLDVTQPSLR